MRTGLSSQKKDKSLKRHGVEDCKALYACVWIRWVRREVVQMGLWFVFLDRKPIGKAGGSQKMWLEVLLCS